VGSIFVNYKGGNGKIWTSFCDAQKIDYEHVLKADGIMRTVENAPHNAMECIIGKG